MSKIRYLAGAGLFTGGASTFVYSFGYNVPTMRAYAQGSTNTFKLHWDFTKPTLDLRDQELTLTQMQEIAEAIASSKHVGHVLWPTDVDSTLARTSEGLALKQTIETKLALNNQNYQMHPSDFVHALLSAHSYYDSAKGEHVAFPSTTDSAKYNQYLTDWYVQEAYSVPKAGRYYAASYINDKDHQLVLAHRGTTVKKEDILATDSPAKTDLVGILAGQIVPQLVQTYVTTKEAAAFAKTKGYAFSTTGHSLGAWLAELSLYFSEFDFNVRTKAVTFDSPGTIIVENFKSNIHHPSTSRNTEVLDITTYLSAPNFVNTAGEHIGRVYRVYPDIWMPGFVKTSTGYFKSFLSKIGMHSKTNDLDLLLSIFGHPLLPIVATFDPLTGRPVKYDQVKKWPMLEYSPSETIGRNMLTEVLGTAGNSVTPNSSVWTVAQVMASGKTGAVGIIGGVTIDLLRQMINPTTFGSVIHLFEEAANGRINQEQYLDYWRRTSKQGPETGYHSLTPSSAEDEFVAKYGAHYEVAAVNPREDVFMADRAMDYYLQQLKYCSDSQIAQGRDPLVAKQLQTLSTHYALHHNGSHSRVIRALEGDTSLTIEQLKYWLGRLISLDESITKLLGQDCLARQYSDRKLDTTFDDTNIKIAEFVRDFKDYSLTDQQDLDSVLHGARHVTKPEYLSALKASISIDTVSNQNFNNYLYCVCRAAYHYEFTKHDGVKARQMLEHAKNLTEDYWIRTFDLSPDVKDVFKAAIAKEQIYSEMPQGAKHLPEMYTKIVYQLGRTYIYQGDRKEAVKYFELSKYLGHQLNLFEEYLSDRSGIGVMAGDDIDAYIRNGALDQAKTKLTEIIALYKTLKVDTKSYKLDYQPNDKPTKNVTPSKDQYNRIECEEQLVKHYAKLISITRDTTERAQYMQEMLYQLRDTGADQTELGLLIELDSTSGRKKASVYNTLGGALLTLHDHNKEEFQRLKDAIKGPLHLRAAEDLGAIKEIYTTAAVMPGTSKDKDFTTAVAYNGLMQVTQKQLSLLSLSSASIPPDQIQQLRANTEEYRQKRDEVNKYFNRSAEHDDIIIPHLPTASQAVTSDAYSWWSDLWSHKSSEHDTSDHHIACSGGHKSPQDEE